ncbi:putative membrane protein [Gammaproteobacteria bacterium]
MLNLTTLFLIILGTILGREFLSSNSAPLLGAIFAWLIGEQWRLRNRITRLENQLNELIVANITAPLQVIINSSESSTAITDPVIHEPPCNYGQEGSTIKSSSKFPWRLWSLIAGENPLARVGVILVFLGIAFLFKHVTMGIYIPLEWRFIATALAGIILLFIGWHLRCLRPGYAMIMQGGGIGVWYLTVFVALRFGLIPPELAFPLLVVIAIFSALLALGQDAPALSFFGAIGGYLAPVLVSTGDGNHVQLFSYYGLLNTGVLGLAWFKAWRSLNLFGFLFTFVISGLWGFFQYQPSHFYTTEPFLILFFLMYVMVAVLFALRQPPQLKGLVDGGLVFGLPVVTTGLQAGVVSHFKFGMAWSALALGGFYLGLAAWLWRREGERLRLLCESFLALGTAFTTLAIPLAVDGHWTSAAWALEGTALVWIGARQARLLTRIAGSLLQLIAGGGILALSWVEHSTTLPLLNSRCLGGLLIALAGMFSSLQLDYHRESLRSWEHVVKGLLLGWGLWWWYTTGGHEIERFVMPGSVRSVLLFFLTTTAFAGIVLRHTLRSHLVAVPTALLLPGMVILDIGAYHYFYANAWSWTIWWSVWILAFVVQYAGLWVLDGDFPNVQIRHLWHAATLWMLAWLLASEINGLMVWWIDGPVSAWEIIAWGIAPAGLAWWVMERGPGVSHWPWNKYRAVYLHHGCGPLLAFAWSWALYVNIANDGAAWLLSYVPLFNPLDFAITFVFLMLPRWWKAITHECRPWTVIHSGKLVKAFVASVFLLLNGIVARTVHHWDDIPYHWRELFASSTFQASLSLLWSTLALTVMATATRRGWRHGWMAGATLLAVVVAKLFFIELVNHGTLARIISFLGVGILLLIIGYLAPLPHATGS